MKKKAQKISDETRTAQAAVSVLMEILATVQETRADVRAIKAALAKRRK